MNTQQLLELTDENFKTEVLESQVPVLVDFWAPWCAPCIQLGPVIEEIAENSGGKFKIGKLNVDQNPETASAYKIQSIPSVLLIKDGEVAEIFIGAQPKHRYEQGLASLVA